MNLTGVGRNHRSKNRARGLLSLSLAFGLSLATLPAMAQPAEVAATKSQSRVFEPAPLNEKETVLDEAYSWIVRTFQNPELHDRTRQRYQNFDSESGVAILDGVDEDVVYAFSRELEASSELLNQLKGGFQFNLSIANLFKGFKALTRTHERTPTPHREKSLANDSVKYGLQLTGFKVETEAGPGGKTKVVPQYAIVPKKDSERALQIPASFHSENREESFEDQLWSALDFKTQIVPEERFLREQDTDAVVLKLRQTSGYYELDYAMASDHEDPIRHRFWMPLDYHLSLRHETASSLKPMSSSVEWRANRRNLLRLHWDHQSSGLGNEWLWSTGPQYISLRSSWSEQEQAFQDWNAAVYELGVDYPL